MLARGGHQVAPADHIETCAMAAQQRRGLAHSDPGRLAIAAGLVEVAGAEMCVVGHR
jgi:hypothetical protein